MYATTLVLMGSIYRVVVVEWYNACGEAAPVVSHRSKGRKRARRKNVSLPIAKPSIRATIDRPLFRRGIPTTPSTTSSAGIHQHTTPHARHTYAHTSMALGSSTLYRRTGKYRTVVGLLWPSNFSLTCDGNVESRSASHCSCNGTSQRTVLPPGPRG